MAGRVTIKDIAAAAGVTPQAVSRALRGADDISPAMKEKIKAIAGKLNYVKNSAASSLRSGGTKMIAVVYDNPINLYFSFMTAYLHESLKARGYSMLMMVEPVRRFSAELYLSVLSRNVDGILSFLEPTEEAGKLVDAYGVPVVLVGRRSDVKNVDCIYTDDKKGGAAAAAYLADRGAKKIVCFSENTDLTCARDRLEGFRTELLRRGIFDEKLCFFLNGENTAKRWNEFLSMSRRFDGVFCFSDLLAYETICVLKTRGIKVPVVGYDDVREKIPIPTALPSVSSDKRGIAESAAAFLLDRIAAREENGEGRGETNAKKEGGKDNGRREKMFDVYLVERK